MIIQIGTEVDESKILWKYKESDEWKRADIDDLIEAYEGRPKGEWGDEGQCPFCGYLRQWEDDNFCGNCGADMRGADNEAD